MMCVLYFFVKLIKCKLIKIVMFNFWLIFFKLFIICFVVNGFNEVIGLFVRIILDFWYSVCVIDICCCWLFDNLLECWLYLFKILMCFSVFIVLILFFFGNKFNIIF